MASLRKEAMKKALPPLPEQFIAPQSARMPSRKIRKDYSPSSWDNYFEARKFLTVKANQFQVYYSGNEGPALVLLHGGGYSALTWALFTKHIMNLCTCQVLAIDLRGHGNTKTEDDENLQADILAQDVADIISAFFEDDEDSIPEVVLLGHSMGGAIAVHAASKELIKSLSLMVVIDVVEGTALDALSQMISFLRGRPSEFRTLEQAIEWSMRSGQVRNLESAKVSMPGQLVRVPNLYSSEPSTSQVDITERDEQMNESSDDVTPPKQSKPNYKYTWRIDLTKTEKYWKGWFSNMSELFLSCKVPKILLLAGVDRLDRALTVGQMQGKFQMQVLPNCGHTMQEDAPDRVAEIVATFMLRYRLANPKTDFTVSMPAC